MTTLDYVIADVFTERPFGGNPLAVFPEVSGLSTELMQTIARELNLSETTFVFATSNPEVSCEVRIFTPFTELPFAGHPTIGTALVLEAIGKLQTLPQVRTNTDGIREIILGEKAGPVPVQISQTAGGKRAVLTSPRIPQPVTMNAGKEILAKVLGLTEAELAVEDLPIAAYSAAVPFLFVPVRDRAALTNIRFNTAVWQEHLQGSEAEQIFPFTVADPRRGREIDARMFAPGMGIVEDPATGAAVAALGGYLADHQELEVPITRWRIQQGFDMGRPSQIDLEVGIANNTILSVQVGGTAVLIGRGSLDLP